MNRKILLMMMILSSLAFAEENVGQTKLEEQVKAERQVARNPLKGYLSDEALNEGKENFSDKTDIFVQKVEDQERTGIWVEGIKGNIKYVFPRVLAIVNKNGKTTATFYYREDGRIYRKSLSNSQLMTIDGRNYFILIKDKELAIQDMEHYVTAIVELKRR